MSQQLVDFIARYRRLFVLTGAGTSTASGIPDYRDEQGEWKHARPVQYRDYVGSHRVRQFYWARASLGWRRFRRARPNRAHLALARLERGGRLARTVTQNVDGLQQRAGSVDVTELHGSLANVVCLSCGVLQPRDVVIERLLAANPDLETLHAAVAPDGDAALDDFDFESVKVPDCEACGGLLKPDLVFFGESVPAPRVREAFAALERADALLVVGSSLMVFSGLRFVRKAAERGLPILALNRGVTRADELFDVKIEADCTRALGDAVECWARSATVL